MTADTRILSLPKVSLETRELLPEESGIYYVIDQYQVIVYIGKAINLQKRWQGSSHHRFKELKATKSRSFNLHYELAPESKLDELEKSLIAQFNPELNDSRVIQGKIRFTEGLLKETLRKLNGYILILGVDLETRTIYLVFDYTQFRKDFSLDINTSSAFLNWIFKSRKKYPNTWQCNDFKDYSFMFAGLMVNGFNIRVKHIRSLQLQKHTQTKDFNHQIINFADEDIPCLTEDGLVNLKLKTPNIDFLKNLTLYKVGMLKCFKLNFDLPSIEEYRQQCRQIQQEFKSGERGIGSQSSKKTSTITFLDQLLSQRKTSSTQFPRVLRRNYSHTEADIFIQCFNLSTFNQPNIQGSAYGRVNGKNIRKNISQFDKVYLLSKCNKKIWLVLEEYLSDYVQIAIDLSHKDFPENTCYAEKLYVSPRRWIKPARLMIKFEGTQSGFGIPFGTSWENPSMSFENIKKEIKTRLSQSDLPAHKLSFTKESIYTKGRRRR